MKGTATHLLSLRQKEFRTAIRTVHDELYCTDSRKFNLVNATTVQSLVYDPGNLSPFTEAIYNILDGRNMQRDWIEQYFSFPCTAGLRGPYHQKAVVRWLIQVNRSHTLWHIH